MQNIQIDRSMLSVSSSSRYYFVTLTSDISLFVVLSRTIYVMTLTYDADLILFEFQPDIGDSVQPR